MAEIIPRRLRIAEFNVTNHTIDGVVVATGGPYSFVVPSNVYYITADYCGGGGGGGGGFATAGGGGGGGGGACAWMKQVLMVTPGETITVTIGAAGSSGSIGSAGGAGGNTTLVSTTLGTRTGTG
ncbi:MAG: hypothetical protein RLZZ182_2174, partial [Pseudomonadota bacterium]